MDLYEVLKSGVAAEDLLISFQKDLNTAQERIKKEEKEKKEIEENKKQNEKHLETCKDNLAFAILDYIDALYPSTAKFEDWDKEYLIIKKELANFEKEMNNITSITEKISSLFSQKKEDNTIDNISNIFQHLYDDLKQKKKDLE